MDKFKRGLSLHKKKDVISESNKPYLWQEDEKKVREGTCSFQVKYLGCIEVFESRGIQICEEAINLLRNSKSKPQRAVLYVAGDALRVVDELSKGLIVDQTIEKVSFCAPDRNNDKGFAYICRDGTTRRWMCHGFMAVKESGERLSHAVGCAFTICLEKKQLREKEKMTVTYSENGGSTLTRTGSFRPATLIERLADPQSAIVAEPIPLKKTDNPFAVERPRAPVDLLHRQGSFSGFTRLSETSSPFKRQMSLRLDELPSTRNRHEELTGEYGNVNHNCQQMSLAISPIAESSPSVERTDCISQICQQLSHGLLASKKPSAAVDMTTGDMKPRDAPEVVWKQPVTGQWNHQVQPVVENDRKLESPSDGDMKGIPHSVPSSVVETSSVTSEAESWLNAIRDGMLMPPSTGSPANGTVATESMATVHGAGLGFAPRQQQPLSAEINACSNTNGTSFVSPFSSILFRTTSLEHSCQSAVNVDRQQSSSATSSQIGVGSFMSNSWGSVSTSGGSTHQGPHPSDPFDAEWAKMASNNARNPFIGGAISNSFELRL